MFSGPLLLIVLCVICKVVDLLEKDRENLEVGFRTLVTFNSSSYNFLHTGHNFSLKFTISNNQEVITFCSSSI